MPQIQSTIPVCNEQTIFTSWIKDNNCIETKKESTEPKFVSLKTDNLNEVTENDSGFATGSDEDDRLNSGSSDGDDCYLNSILDFGFPRDTTKSFGHLNVKENGVNKFEESSNKSTILNCIDKNEKIDVSLAAEPVLLKTDNFDFWNKTSKKETIEETSKSVYESDSDVNLLDLLRDITTEEDDKMVNSVIPQNNSKLSIGKDSLNSESYEGSVASYNFDNICSDLFTSLNFESSCNNEPSKWNKITGDDNSNEVKNSFSFNNEESLSDLLASICDESNLNETNNSSIKDTFGFINQNSNEIDDNDISLASLAEKYLSSGTSNNLITSTSDDCVDLSENILMNLEIFSDETIKPLSEKNAQESFDMCDLFASVNKDPDNQVTLSAEKCIHDAESCNDEIGGNLEIDLTSCLISDKLSNSSSKHLNVTNQEVTQETYSDLSHLQTSPTVLLKKEIFSPLTEKKRTNSRQSLFAKALSCKPKKDKSAALKVLSIQKQFCERLSNIPEGFLTNKPLKQVVSPANDFIYSAMGRRIFDHGKFKEIK